MSDFSMVPGTLVQMRIARRFAHYTIGDVIAVPMDQAQDLAMRRLAQPLAIMVPTKADEASAESKPADPIRQPAQVVRK
jgi:hypothetical protein